MAVNITIEGEESTEETPAEIIADAIHEESEEESEIDEKWLDSKFSAIENRATEILSEVRQMRESMPMDFPRTLAELTTMVVELTRRLSDQAILTAEIQAESSPFPETLPEPEAEVQAEIVLPANVEDQRAVEAEESHPRKRRAI